MVIIMLGAPATGKGTVAGILSQELNIPSISSGDIFRKNMSEGTEFGKRIKEYMDKGELVPDELVLEMITSRLNEDDVKDGVILDGFPRTLPQAEALDKMLEKENKKIDMVVNLETPREELLERTINRRNCSNKDCNAIYNLVLHPPKVEGICDICGSPLYQRDDAKPEVAKNRLEVYDRETAPLVGYYEKTGVLYTTILSQKANRMKDEVAKDVLEKLKK